MSGELPVRERSFSGRRKVRQIREDATRALWFCTAVFAVVAVRREIEPIAGMSHRDDVVDNLRYTIFGENLTHMMEDPQTITRCIDCVMIARYLERCVDHTCDYRRPGLLYGHREKGGREVIRRWNSIST